MAFHPSDLWRWDGTIGRRLFLTLGFVLMAVKYNLDRLVAAVAFGRPWSLLSYYKQGTRTLLGIESGDIPFFLTMVALALPFIWAGVGLTLRRLRSIGLPSWLVAFFFVPVVNLLFFLALAALPDQPSHAGERVPQTAFLDRLIPRSKSGSAVAGVMLGLLLGVPLTLLGVMVMGKYGWGLFVGLPFTTSLLAVLIYSYHEQRSLAACVSIGLGTVTTMGVTLMAVAIEGVICLLMAAPIGWVMAILGAWCGYLIQSGARRNRLPPAVLPLLILAVPMLMGAEALADLEPPLIAVQTAVEIEAPPQVVWAHVVQFSELPPPEDLLFRLGVAYPQRAVIKGQGVGAVRECVFSTGPFVEPITVWDEPRRLAFDVTSQPPAMKELSYTDIDAPHLDDYLVSKGGQFLLTPVSPTRTRLEGTTWYRHNIWPATYWQVWSDGIIHRIHLRVLTHIKQEAEQAVQAARPDRLATATAAAPATARH
jgi:hypothetical protein